MTPESKVALIERFYAAFARLDGEALAACYAPDATFSDPICSGRTGAEPGAMWRMLTCRAKDFRDELVERSATETSGSARWIADHQVGKGARPVTNDVRATFRLAGGQIAEHRDDFDFSRWARQALGLPGLVLGWASPLRSAIQRKSRAQVADYMAASRPTGA